MAMASEPTAELEEARALHHASPRSLSTACLSQGRALPGTVGDL